MSTLLKIAKPGRDILFKRSEGRGRPALGKIIKVNPKNHSILAATASGFERVRPHMITRIVQNGGKVPKIDPLMLAKAEHFEEQQSAN